MERKTREVDVKDLRFLLDALIHSPSKGSYQAHKIEMEYSENPKTVRLAREREFSEKLALLVEYREKEGTDEKIDEAVRFYLTHLHLGRFERLEVSLPDDVRMRDKI